jgi:hypothetical protein
MVLSIFAKSENDAKMSKFSWNFVSRKFSFSRKFSRKWARFCDEHKMINSNENLTILVHVHYCCPICFEAPFGFNNFEVHGQYSCPICFEAPSGVDNREVHAHYCCPICFEAPSGVDNREVHVHYCCPICFEAPSGFDILRYFHNISGFLSPFSHTFSFSQKFFENFREIVSFFREKI